MSILSSTTQQRVEDDLVEDGLISDVQLKNLKAKAQKTQQPILSLLINEGHITDEQLTRARAKVDNIPYVNLSNARVEPKILGLLPYDVAEHYMAVPLGYDSAQKKLIVGMLDAGNVQAVDFLSKKIGQAIRVYAASEPGIRKILEQYDRSQGITSILNLPEDIGAESKKVSFAPVGTAQKEV